MNKQNDGGSVEVREVKSFEDWTAQIKKTVDFPRGNGVIDHFTIYALTAEQVQEINEWYHDQVPPEVKLAKGPKGEVLQDRHYDDRIKKRNRIMMKLNQDFQYRYILYGWADPNGIEIPGKTLDKKIASLKKGVAGDAQKLFDEIVRLSNIGRETVDFF